MARAERRRERYLREGFALAKDNAEISDWDGWEDTAPFIDWRAADKALEDAVSVAPRKKGE